MSKALAVMLKLLIESTLEAR